MWKWARTRAEIKTLTRLGPGPMCRRKCYILAHDQVTAHQLVSLVSKRWKEKKATPRLLTSSSSSHVQLLCRSCCLSKNCKLGQEISVGMVLLWNSKLFYWPKGTISRFVSWQFLPLGFDKFLINSIRLMYCVSVHIWCVNNFSKGNTWSCWGKLTMEWLTDGQTLMY